MPRISAQHQADIDVKQRAQHELLAYHHILQSIAEPDSSGKWGGLQRVGSVHDKGDSWTWQLAFTPRLRDAVILEIFNSRVNGGKTVRCFFLRDTDSAYHGRSFDSNDSMGKLQQLYLRAKEMETLELNREFRERATR